MEVRTRFAPSPTGYMHIGNLRTALYSYLIAKSNHGKFILRIEDTDKNRFVDGSIDIILKTLKTAKLNYDEGPYKEGNCGPYFQSQRLGIYISYALQLVNQGDAYYCFCPEAKTDLDQYKEDYNYSTGIGYNGHCRNLSKEEVEKNLKEGKPYVIRQKIPKNIQIKYEDEVFGKLVFNSDDLDDQVLIKQDGYPTYNFANVIDDHLMNITHIVRGNEYLSSTPKYVLLYKAFNWDIPKFIHLPIINGRDSEGNVSKLSKRHGSVSFQDLVKDGYLPEAILNYIMFLGWNPKTNQEIFSLDELISIFNISQLNKAASIFDYTKLDWFNQEYIAKMSDINFINYGLYFLNGKEKLFNWKYVAPFLKNKKITKFSELENKIKFLLDLKDYNISDLLTYKNKQLDINLVKNILADLYDSVNSHDSYETILNPLSEKYQIKFGIVMWIFRVAISGLKNTPLGGYEIAIALGCDEIKNRLQYALEKVNNTQNKNQ